MASREGKQGCGEPHALAHSDKALRSQRYAFMHDSLCYKHCFSTVCQLIWHADRGRAGPRRGAFIPFGVRAAASPFFQIMFRGPDYADENIL